MKKSRLFLSAVTMLCISLVTTSVSFAETAISSENLSDEKKSEYYAQYVEITQEMAKDTGIPVTIVPIEDVQAEDWVSPEEFESNLEKNLENYEIIVEASDSESYSTTATKEITANFGNGLYMKINVTGSFKTRLSSSAGRQIFSGINSITTAKNGGTGTWIYDSYSAQLMDGGREYQITISGNIRNGSNYYPVDTNVNFYCSSTGVVTGEMDLII